MLALKDNLNFTVLISIFGLIKVLIRIFGLTKVLICIFGLTKIPLGHNFCKQSYKYILMFREFTYNPLFLTAYSKTYCFIYKLVISSDKERRKNPFRHLTDLETYFYRIVIKKEEKITFH